MTRAIATGHERWNAFTREQQESHLHVVPDVCIEVRSKNDSAAILRRKLLRYRVSGAAYVVLIDPYERTTWSDGTAPEGFPTDFSAVFDV